jgi:hypothetical protein
MKELFPGFYPMSSDKIDVAAKTTLVAFDANVLLNLYRYGRVFVGHNGAQSYYAARAFRGSLRV